MNHGTSSWDLQVTRPPEPTPNPSSAYTVQLPVRLKSLFSIYVWLSPSVPSVIFFIFPQPVSLLSPLSIFPHLLNFPSLKENTDYDRQPWGEILENNSRQKLTDGKTKREMGGKDWGWDKIISVVKAETQAQADRGNVTWMRWAEING